MAAVIICSDFGNPPNKKSLTVSIVPPSISHEVRGTGCHDLHFLNVSFKPAFSLSSFTFIKRFFSSSLSAIRLVSYVSKTEVIDISPGNLDSSLCFIQPGILQDVLCNKLSKQGDNIQSWHTPFLTWNQSIVPCPVLTVASWPAYRFLRRQVRRSSTNISLRIFQFVVRR